MGSVQQRHDNPDEEPGRPFALWWDNYQDPNLKIRTTGSLFGKCRDAAAAVVDDLTANAPLPAAARTNKIRMLACLILDAYENDRWVYDPD